MSAFEALIKSTYLTKGLFKFVKLPKQLC